MTQYPPSQSEFNQRTLPVDKYQAQPWYRLNRSDKPSALYFDRSGKGRFDKQNGSYGILYLAERPHGAFAETFLRDLNPNLPIRTVSSNFIQQRNLFEISCDRALSLVKLYGNGLAKLSIDSNISSMIDINYQICRAWTEVIHNHPQQIDGIAYLSRLDNTQLCFGLFDRVKSSLTENNLGDLTKNPNLLGKLVDHYGCSYIDN